jgi:hypothetical protein
MAFGAVQTRLSALPKRNEGILVIDLPDALWLTFFIFHPTTHSNHHPKPQTQGGRQL